MQVADTSMGDRGPFCDHSPWTVPYNSAWNKLTVSFARPYLHKLRSHMVVYMNTSVVVWQTCWWCQYENSVHENENSKIPVKKIHVYPIEFLSTKMNCEQAEQVFAFFCLREHSCVLEVFCSINFNCVSWFYFICDKITYSSMPQS